MRLLHDLRVAVRAVLRMRFVSALAVAAFALGIGVTTAVFSIFNSVLLKPLPYPEAERIMMVFDTQPACSTCPASYPKYIDWKTRNAVFSVIGGSMSVRGVVTGTGDPERVSGMATTASLVEVFGVQPRLGRWYSEEEDQPGGPKVVVLAHEFVATHFPSAEGILGRTLSIDGVPHEIVGVMPPGFVHRGAKYFVPLQRANDPAQRGTHFLVTFGRLKDGVTPERASSDMRALGEQLAREFGHNHGIDVRSYFEALVGNVRTALRVLLGAVLLVLLIACANVANLLLASGMARRRELAVRLALGARPRDLARQLTLESLVLSLSGAALGVLLAQWIVRTFVALAGTQLPRAASVAIDADALAFSAAVAVLVGLFCGVWPLLILRAGRLAAEVREGDTRTAIGGGRRIGNALVVAEIALAFTLLVGAGLLVKNLMRLQARDVGLRTDRIVAFDIAPAGPKYSAPEQVSAFYRDLYERLARVGTVESAGMISHLPIYNTGYNSEFEVEGGAPWGPRDAPLVEHRWMFGNYLKTMAIPLVRGRLLDERDGSGTRTVLINQAMAEKFWPGKDPIGRRFGQGRDASAWYTVVGVIGSVRSYGLARPAPYEFYRTLDQSAFNSMTVVIRTRGEDPTTVIPTARQVVASIDPGLPIASVQTMEQVVSQSVSQPRLMSALTALFGGLAGLLAVVGIYGVTAYNVRRQRREFGIRMALGAAGRQVRGLVIARGLALAVVGVALGALGARVLTGLLVSMLHDVKPTDPAVFAATGLGILVVALLASYLPARSAARVDPLAVLRVE